MPVCRGRDLVTTGHINATIHIFCHTLNWVRTNVQPNVVPFLERVNLLLRININLKQPDAQAVIYSGEYLGERCRDPLKRSGSAKSTLARASLVTVLFVFPLRSNGIQGIQDYSQIEKRQVVLVFFSFRHFPCYAYVIELKPLHLVVTRRQRQNWGY